MNTVAAAIAANRFGLGARPGDLRQISNDPRGWLLAQLVPEKTLPASLAALPTTAEDEAAFFIWLRDFGREARAAKRQSARAASSDTGDANGMSERSADANGGEAKNGVANVQGSFAKSLLPRYQAAIAARFQTAVESNAPFRERLMHFWSNHFVVSGAKPAAVALPPSYERDIARTFVMGRFGDMLQAAEKHPSMLLYLDNVQSIGPNSSLGLSPGRVRKNPLLRGKPGKAKGLNENLAREILELHTLGVDGGYTQADVTSFARVITGWQIASPLKNFRFKRFQSWTAEDFFYFNADAHEPGVQQVLGKSYAQSGARQGVAVLDDLARHPSTAHFIATKLARHFVGDVPPAPVVDRLSKSFRDSEGDLRTVYRTLVQSPEAWQPTPLKFKQPEEHLISAVRGLGGPVMNGQRLLAVLNEMGQRPYWQPGPNGWKDAEAEWLSPDILWKRLEWSTLAGRAMASAARDPMALADELLGATLGEHTRQALANADSPAQGIALLLSSPEFLRR